MLYTVVLDRPLALAEASDTEPYENTYTAIGVDAPLMLEAKRAAQKEAFEADVAEWGKKAMHRWEILPQDYRMIVMFEGAHTPCAWAFDVIGRKP